ncbi:hypothetical protein [Lacinutrix chionoecetis]
MFSQIPSHLPDSPIYRKAMDIFLLSHNISAYLNDDLSALKSDGKEDEHIYFSGDIVQQSVSLAPEIIRAELELYSENKHKHLSKLRTLTNRLYRNCSRLEKCNSNGREYIPVLRKELNKFKKLQRTWALTL